MTAKKKSKPKTQGVIMVQIDKPIPGLDIYSAIDEDAVRTLGGRKSFEAQIPVMGRSLSQQAIWEIWYRIIGKEVGEKAITIKRQCKLAYGVPILCEWDPGFKAIWEAKFADDSEEKQLFMMRYLPVTSLMNKHPGSLYTEMLQRKFSEQSIILEVL